MRLRSELEWLFSLEHLSGSLFLGASK